MAKHQFTSAERYAVFTAHGGVCYICDAPVTMKTFEVDHVVPEHLGGSPNELAEARAQLGLPDDFNVNSYENWAPSCSGCNGKKLAMVWKPSLQIQSLLQRMQQRAPKARAIATEVVTSQKVARALTLLEAANEHGELSPQLREALRPLVEGFVENRPGDVAVESVQLTHGYSAPLYEVLGDDGMTMTVKGPYGIGGGPSAPASSGMRCGVCGLPYFNGARCVICGSMDDD